MAQAIQSQWIFLKRVTKNTGYVFAGVDKLLWDIFASPLLHKNEISLIHSRNLKFVTSQEIRTGPIKPGDVSQLEITRFAMCKQRNDQSRKGGNLILNSD